MKEIAYSKGALRTLRRMPTNIAGLIVAKVERFAEDGGSMANNVRALTGRPGEFRLRVGDWRVIMTESGDVIAVIKIGPRGSIYED